MFGRPGVDLEPLARLLPLGRCWGGGSWVMSMLRVCTSASVWMLFLPPRGLLLACGELGGLPVSELCPFSLGGGEGESLRG